MTMTKRSTTRMKSRKRLTRALPTTNRKATAPMAGGARDGIGVGVFTFLAATAASLVTAKTGSEELGQAAREAVTLIAPSTMAIVAGGVTLVFTTARKWLAELGS